MMAKYRLTVLLLLCMIGISNLSTAQQSKATSKVTIDMTYVDADGKKHSETIEYVGKEAEDFDADEYEKSLELRDIKILNLNINQSVSKASEDDAHEAHDVKIKRKPGKGKKSVTVKKIIVSTSDADKTMDSDTYKMDKKDGKIVINGKEVDGSSKQIRIMKTMDSDTEMEVEVKDGKVFINGEEIDESEINQSSEHQVIIKKDLLDDEENIWISKDGDDVDLERIMNDLDGTKGKMIFISDDEDQKPRLGIMIEDGKVVNGAEVVDIVADSPAAKGGLLKGDVVTAINDLPVYGVSSMMDKVHDFKPGDIVRIAYNRNGKSMTSKIKLEMMNSEINKTIIIKE